MSGRKISEEAVAQHYSHGALETQILNALARIGVDPEQLRPDELAPVDEFPVGLCTRFVLWEGLINRLTYAAFD